MKCGDLCVVLWYHACILVDVVLGGMDRIAHISL